MPIDHDAAFVAEIKVLSHAVAIPGEFLQEVVQRLSARMPGWDWVGLYFLSDDTLVLGPYVGAPTEHVSIPSGSVCGSAAAQDSTLAIDEVRLESSDPTCSSSVRQELVVLIRDRGEVVGQFDRHSDRVGAFRRQDEMLLERLSSIVSSACRSERDRLARQGLVRSGNAARPSE